MEKDLTVIEQKEVLFYEDTIVVILVKDGTVYVPIRPLCEFLGVNWDAQRRRINRESVLSEEVMPVVVTTTDIALGSRTNKHDAGIAPDRKRVSGERS